MKKGFLYFICCLFILGAQAQTSSIRKAYAFYKPINYGQQMVDLQGNPVERKDTAWFVYLETKGSPEPVIKSTWLKGRYFTASVYPVQGSKETVGMLANGRKKIITAQRGYKLWRVELQSAPTGIRLKGAAQNLLIGTFNKKAFQYKLATPVLLEGDIVG